MGTILVADVLDRAAVLLYDETKTHWTEDELTDWLNDAQRELVALKPDTNVVNQAVQLAEGTKQSLPATGIIFQRLVRNMGDGSTPGRAITRTDMDVLDRFHPDWHTDDPASEVTHYMFDPRDPKHFYVWKPQPSSGQGHVEIVYTANPTDVDTPTNDPNGTIQLDDIYEPVLIDLILWRALSKQSDQGYLQVALGFLNRARSTLGMKEVGEQSAEPRSRRGGNQQ